MPRRHRRSPGRPTPIRGETVPYPTSPYRDRPPLVTPALVVDAVILERGRVLLVQRGRPPFLGKWALPGGFVELGETTEAAIRREVREETGVLASVRALVGVYSAPRRDPRAHLVSVAYRLTRRGGSVHGGDDAQRAAWFPVEKLPPLAGDHARILGDALRAASPGRPRARERARPRT